MLKPDREKCSQVLTKIGIWATGGLRSYLANDIIHGEAGVFCRDPTTQWERLLQSKSPSSTIEWSDDLSLVL